MAPEIVTVLVAEVDGRYGAAAADRVQDVVLRAGAADVDTQQTGGDRRVWAEFHSVGDSALAAVEVARTLAAVVGGRRPGEPVTGLRVALCTGPNRTRGGGTGTGPSPRDRATALVERAAPGQILATAATAIMTGGGLPPGVDLVDRGSRSLAQGRPAERIYEMRIDGLGGGRAGGGPDAGADRAGEGTAPSNLEWARRAVAGVDGAVPDLDDHLEALTGAWRAAVGGGRHSVLLSGRGGAGKTRLAAELALRLHAEGALVLYGRWDRDVPAPYQGVREALGVYADGCSVEQLRADLEGWGDEIARLLPDVGARIGGPGGGARPKAAPAAAVPGDPGDGQVRLFDAVEAWIRALARRR